MPQPTPSSRLSRALACSAALAFALVSPLPAAAPPAPPTPRDELLRHVPDDVGFCLVVQGARAHAAQLAASPFAEQFRLSPLGKAVAASPELKKFAQVDRVLAKQTGLSWARLRDDVLGEAVAFAYRPGPPGKPEQEQGLVLVRARSAAALADVVDRFNQAQKGTGELHGLEERGHRGVTYYRRAERKSPTFYCLQGPVLLFSGQEAMLKRAIELGLAARGEPAVTARLRELGLAEGLLVLWVNPRAWDAEVSARATGADGARTFAVYWKALQGLALAVDLDRALTVRLAVKARTEALPAAAQKYLKEAARPSELWRQFPDNALLAVAGRVDAAALFAVLGELMSKEAREGLHADLERTVGALVGRSVVKEVLPALGPDWGLCLTAPPPGAKGWAPRAVFAVKVGRGPDEAAPVDRAVLSALDWWVKLGVVAHNGKHPDRPITPKTKAEGKLEIRYLEGEKALPPGVRPCFALKDGYLVLASTLEGLRRFGARRGPAPAGPVPLVRVSFVAWRGYLKDHREALGQALAGRDGLTKEQALARLDEVRANLELVESLELRQKVGAGQVTFTLTLTTARPLRR